jgi:hypothetical protein
MNRYEIEAVFRSNVNKQERVCRHVWVDAPNREAALLIAGNRLGLEGTGMVNSSVQVSVARQRRI